MKGKTRYLLLAITVILAMLVLASCSLAPALRLRGFSADEAQAPADNALNDAADTGDAGDPANLELELTETTLMDKPEEAAALLKALKRRGISLAIDDFGTGYSSLSHLKHFPIDRLKIDRSFINDLTRSPEDGAIVEAIIAMAHRLNLEAVAEGVEHADQCTLLQNWGCTTSQGFLFSHPLPAQAVTTLLASGMHQIDSLLPSV